MHLISAYLLIGAGIATYEYIRHGKDPEVEKEFEPVGKLLGYTMGWIFLFLFTCALWPLMFVLGDENE